MFGGIVWLSLYQTSIARRVMAKQMPVEEGSQRVQVQSTGIMSELTPNLEFLCFIRAKASLPSAL